MGAVSTPLPVRIMMTPEILQEVWAAKRERRTRLANLPIDEKVDLIEKLHELAQTMVAARASLPPDVRQKTNRDQAG